MFKFLNDTSIEMYQKYDERYLYIIYYNFGVYLSFFHNKKNKHGIIRFVVCGLIFGFNERLIL